MAQLTDSCFEAGDTLMPLSDALAHLATHISCIKNQVDLPLAKADGYILAEDLIAQHNVPPHANSAVDGYAVRFADLKSSEPSILPVGARLAAGDFLGRPLAKGEAVRIFTGAPVPDGADTVMMQEDCSLLEDGRVSILPGIKQGANRRKAGEDMQKGDVILAKGQKLSAPQIAVAAAQGYASLPVYEKLTIALFSSGNEVNEVGQSLPDGGIYDANRPMLKSLLKGWDLEVHDLGILPDDPAKMEIAFLEAARRFDLLVSSAGMSVGEEDHLSKVIEKHGRMNFWKIAIKPGRPVGLGMLQLSGKSTPVLGLPGNPVAAFLTCSILGRVLVQRLSGARVTEPMSYPCILGEDFRKKTGREEYLRVSLSAPDTDTGLPSVTQYGQRGAAILSSLQGADGFVRLADEMEHPKAGSKAEFLPIEGLLNL